jgi:hypothetical protein
VLGLNTAVVETPAVEETKDDTTEPENAPNPGRGTVPIESTTNPNIPVLDPSLASGSIPVDASPAALSLQELMAFQPTTYNPTETTVQIKFFTEVWFANWHFVVYNKYPHKDENLVRQYGNLF